MVRRSESAIVFLHRSGAPVGPDAQPRCGRERQATTGTPVGCVRRLGWRRDFARLDGTRRRRRAAPGPSIEESNAHA
jgi:hypothetical protein